MKSKILLLSVIIITSFQSKAQFGKINESKYYMSFEPVVGSLKGTSNIMAGVNPNLTLKEKGFLYGIDWVSARWANVESGYLVPKVLVPIKIRTMRSSDNKGLSTSDGTYFPEEPAVDSKDKATSPFTYFDASIDFYYSPFYIKAGPAIISPKIGFGVDIARHRYNIDLSKYIGKEGTNTGLPDVISSSYSPFYSYSFWEDLYGFNIGSYLNFGKRVMVDAGWEYYPLRFMTKLAGKTIHTNYNAVPAEAESKSSKLSRVSVKAQVRVVSWISLFVKFEHSGYKFEGPILLGDQKFYQKYSNLLFGVTFGGPKLDK